MTTNMKSAKDERAYGERNEDAYQSRGKYPEPSVCTGCGAVFHKGRWQWATPDDGAHKHLCPACQRIHDRVPAGIVKLSGSFFVDHQQEIMSLVHNTEAKEKHEHPLQRIMSINFGNNGVEIALTDFHLTQAIGKAVHHAYKGELDSRFVDKDGVMHVSWTR